MAKLVNTSVYQGVVEYDNGIEKIRAVRSKPRCYKIFVFDGYGVYVYEREVETNGVTPDAIHRSLTDARARKL